MTKNKIYAKQIHEPNMLTFKLFLRQLKATEGDSFYMKFKLYVRSMKIHLLIYDTTLFLEGRTVVSGRTNIN